jgi:hypothetical protein
MAGRNISRGLIYAVGVELTDEQWLAIADLFPDPAADHAKEESHPGSDPTDSAACG